MIKSKLNLEIIQKILNFNTNITITRRKKIESKTLHIPYKYIQHHTMEALNYKLSPLSVAIGTLVKIAVIRSK